MRERSHEPGPRAARAAPRPVVALWLLAAVLLCTLSGWVAYHRAYAASARAQMAAASRGVASISAALNSLLVRHESLPRLLALDPRLVAAVGAPGNGGTIAAANLYLAEFARRGDLLAAFLIDARGTTIAASNWNRPVSFVGMNYAFRPYFKDALAHGAGRFYAVGATSGEPGYFLASDVHTPNGEKGVVVVKVALEPTLRASGGVNGESVAVVDESGVVFLSSDPALLYRPIEPLSEADVATLRATQRYGDRLGAPLFAQPNRSGDPETLVLARDDLRRAVRPLWHRLDDRGWQVVAFQDLQPARAAGLLGALAGVLAAALLVAAAVAVRLRRERARQLERSREQLRQSEERLRAVVDNLPVMVCFISRAERYVFANALYAQQYGCDARELEGKTTAEVLDPEEYAVARPQMARALAGETVVFEREYRHLRDYRCFEATYRPEWNAARTEVTGVHVMTQDVTQTRQRLQHLDRLSQLDHLTQLMNRKGFDARLAEALSAAQVEGQWLALLFIDLDGFKPINDTHGHAAGDAVLTAFARRLSRLVRAEDVVARLGGDEFAVLLPAVADVAVAERVAASVVRLVERPFTAGGHALTVGASVGVAWRRHGQPIGAQALCHAADTYLYDAKRRGRRTYVAGEASEPAAPAS